ncbi:MAG: hypothetical protein Q4B45_06425 [Coriobacteriia bacterium]|nr:hypothetical protein [Coriobacteriia bacterium]
MLVGDADALAPELLGMLALCSAAKRTARARIAPRPGRATTPPSTAWRAHANLRTELSAVMGKGDGGEGSTGK